MPPPSTGFDTSVTDDTTAGAATRTVTLSVAVRLVPLAVTVSSYSSAAASVSAGAVTVGSWIFDADRSTVVPVTLRHEYVTLSPQGPPASPPSVFFSPAFASIPPSGPATATGRNLALPGLPLRVRVVSCFSGWKMRSGSDSRSLCSRRSVLRFVSPANSPAGRVIRLSEAWVWL